MIKDPLTATEFEYAVNGVYIPPDCFFYCPKCAESRNIFVSEDPRCPVCNVPYKITTPILHHYDPPQRLHLSAIKGHVLKITKV